MAVCSLPAPIPAILCHHLHGVDTSSGLVIYITSTITGELLLQPTKPSAATDRLAGRLASNNRVQSHVAIYQRVHD
jgi:hypothetical protein